MDVPEFQRLRRIKQLGNASRIYPSATHTRFEHSIGVMHLAGVMCKVLGVSDRLTQLIQLAGLYHDVGHLPYSHLFDKVLELIKAPDIPHAHEDRSTQTFLLVSRRLQLLTTNEEEFVCACIHGKTLPNFDHGVVDTPCDFPPVDPYLFQIISSDVDVDKLDYLCRDAYHTGMPSFQANYIILNARLNSEKRIVFRRKAMEDIKDMFETRRRMHELVYQHPVSLQFDTMYTCMILRVQSELKFDGLCDYKLESILMENPLTAETYAKMECRKKIHSELCDRSCPIITKHIPNSGSVDLIEWAD